MALTFPGVDRRDQLVDDNGRLLPKYAEQLIKSVAVPRAIFEGGEYRRVRDRRKRQFRRYLILSEEHGGLIWEEIKNRYSDEETKAQLLNWISVRENVALEVTDKVATVFRPGVRRVLSGGTEKSRDAFRSLIEESLLDVWAPTWARHSWFSGPVTVIPNFRAKRLCWDTLLPHQYEVVPDPDDPFGTPVAVAYADEPTNADPSRRYRQAPSYKIVDGHSWRTYSLVFGAFRETSDVVEHGLGEFPGATLRSNAALDWWGGNLHQRLEDATLEVGIINAALGFVRKAQNKQLLTLVGPLDGAFAKRQTLDPDLPLTANTGNRGGSGVTINTLNFDTSPDNFARHISLIKESVYEAYDLITTTPGFYDASDKTITPSGGSRVTDSFAGLTEQRNRQLVFARPFDKELLGKANRLARRFKHSLHEELPSDEDFTSGYSAEYGRLTRQFADPKAEREHRQWEMRMGLTSPRQMMRDENPGLDEAELKKRQNTYLQETSEWNDEVTKRNLATQPNGQIQTAAESNGARGPEVRDQNKPQPDGEERNGERRRRDD